jgi:hypothetical protein
MYNYTGGRIFTYREKGHQWESGAGRLHKSHIILMKYLKEYGLTPIPIPSATNWISQGSLEKDIWPAVSEIVESALERLDPKLLATHTVEQLTFKEPLLHRFPYKSEVATLRADLALKSFHNEMGGDNGFYVIKEGFSELTDRIKATLVKRGVKFLYHHRLISVDELSTKLFEEHTSLYFEITNKKHKPPVARGSEKQKPTCSYITLQAKKAILAVHADALRGISPFSNLPALKNIAMTPLLRTYGVFKNPVNIPKAVTDSTIRYVIPINKNTIMTSYTDSTDTIPWKKIYDEGGDAALGPAVMTGLRKLFPDVENPTFFKSHYWKHGCSYWLPGLYDPEEESRKIMQPIPLRFPNIFVCGESYSMRQAWVEGALEHAEQMLQTYMQCE